MSALNAEVDWINYLLILKFIQNGTMKAFHWVSGGRVKCLLTKTAKLQT